MTIGEQIDRERTRRVIKHATHNQKDHGNRDGGKTTYVATIEQHKRNYSGVLRKSPARKVFDTKLEAKEFVEDFFRKNTTPLRFGVVESTDESFYSSTPTDGPHSWNDWDNNDNWDEEVTKHNGPGDHPGGTPQSTHGRGARNASTGDIKEATDKGGITIRTMTGERPEKGFAVAMREHEKVVPKARNTQASIGQYLRDNYETLSQPGFFFGTWNDTSKGVVVYDVSKVIDGDDYVQAFDAAVKFGKEGDQDAIFDLQATEDGTIVLSDEQAITDYRQGLET
jgi:hypothetical protein